MSEKTKTLLILLIAVLFGILSCMTFFMAADAPVIKRSAVEKMPDFGTACMIFGSSQISDLHLERLHCFDQNGPTLSVRLAQK